MPAVRTFSGSPESQIPGHDGRQFRDTAGSTQCYSKFIPASGYSVLTEPEKTYQLILQREDGIWTWSGLHRAKNVPHPEDKSSEENSCLNDTGHAQDRKKKDGEFLFQAGGVLHLGPGPLDSAITGAAPWQGALVCQSLDYSV
ncbi:hypothetical protein RRG08_041248 [Elysia crispata]|uniref:Uncharacterized protein n=1 Tax=Elysia crispata TaxID=231223 RepID=A0AAE0Z8N9_9GAST|nr:hypothetical protein RRG08_041248 [Elysia crispata]